MFAGSRDDGAHFEEAGVWPDDTLVVTEATLDAATIEGTSVTPVDAPYALGATYYDIDTANPAGATLYLTLAGEAGTRWGLVTAAWPEGGGAATVKRRSTEGTSVGSSIVLTGAGAAEIGVVNLGPADLDPEDSSIDRLGFTLSFTYTDPGTETTPTEGDTGTAPTDDTAPTGATDTSGETQKIGGAVDGGCGCASGSGRAGLGIAGLAMALATRRRAIGR